MHQYKMSRTLFIMCWIVYAAAYVGRISYYTSLQSIISNCGFTNSEAGLIGTAFFFCYGFGQLISGLLGDRISPFKMILTGLILSGFFNLLISSCHNYIYMTIIWGFNGFAQSMLWSPILYIFVHILHPDTRNKACLYITTSVPAGTVITYLISMVILKYSHWNVIFIFSSIILFITAILWLCISIYSSKILMQDESNVKRINNVKPASEHPQKLFPLLLSSGGAVVLLSIMIHGMLKEGVSIWVPTMISDKYHYSSSFSVFLSTFLPIVSLVGPYAINFFYKKKLKQNEVKSAVFCLASAVPPLCLLIFIGTLPAAVCILMLALISASMNAFNYITVTLIPVRFSSYHKASTATGLLNSITYVGSALSTYGFGLISDYFGWNNTIIFWIGLAIIGIALCISANHRWQQFIILQDSK